jgi:hypothetical protein
MIYFYRKIMDIIRAQEQRNDLHEFFHNQVKYQFNAIFIGPMFSLANNICRRIHNCHVVTKGSSVNQLPYWILDIQSIILASLCVAK